MCPIRRCTAGAEPPATCRCRPDCISPVSSPHLLALQWTLRQPQVTSALIGASSTWQLDHNLKALQFPPLTDEELGLIDRYGVHGTGSR